MIGLHNRKPHRNRDRGEAHPTRNEVALAMELRTEGVCWRLIGEGLGYTGSQIKGAVYRASSS